MNLLELIDKRKQASEKLQTLTRTVKTIEKRKFTEDEEVQFNELEVEIKEIDIQIEKLDNEERNINIKTIINTKPMKEFRLLNAINEFLNGKELSEETRSVFETGKEMLSKTGFTSNGLVIPMDYRAITAANSSSAIATQPVGMIESLKANLVLADAGAIIMSGLTSNTVLPRMNATNASWEEENTEITDKGIAIDGISLTPKRLCTTIKVSKQFLTQQSVDAEMYIQNELASAIASKLESTVFESTVSGKAPQGLFNGILDTGVAGLTINGVVDYKKIVALESAVEGANVKLQNPVYITTPTGKGILKTTQTATNSPKMICEAGEVNGYKLLSTSNIKKFVDGTEQGIVFGNFSDLVLANWGVMALEFEDKPREYSVYITINSFWDIAKKHNESFAIGSIK